MPFTRIWSQGVLQVIFHLMLSGGSFVVEIYCVEIQIRLNNHTKMSLVSCFLWVAWYRSPKHIVV